MADESVIAHRVTEVEGDVTRLYDRTRPVDEHGRRLKTIEEAQREANKQRSEDRTEFLAEIKELRRTIIQATLAILVAMIAAIVTFSQIAGAGPP